MEKILLHLGIYRYDVYKSPNIGLFAKANDSIIIVPFGFAETKTSKLIKYLQVEEVYASVANTRIIGSMTVMNNNGILVPSIASDEEIQILKKTSGLNVERLETKFTAIGNLISTNDNGALVSPLFNGDIDEQVRDVLGVQIHSMRVAGFIQTGSMVVATNTGVAYIQRHQKKKLKQFLKHYRFKLNLLLLMAVSHLCPQA